ncbi:maleylacetoacetate isomerase [Chelatococcus sp. SYSU_G07232]|uniref:Maleylacetoacetate isomerase n=1 Tax=Chelatococcus albus TaxID=3047466 RepID=A0ABT7AKF2_9HYPH|nr:maleylacetoacetate isomerase [Chelatococcus sp. SYSU_G07232]MDJ1159844.1 maleylacetoacetate isomerase [Chelatococcus sp. SYSU_G07232]
MTIPQLTLYSYFRSSAAFRVRIALNLKGVAYDIVPVHLLRDGGEHRKDWYKVINPQMRVPSLAVEHGGERRILIQSPAILEWIEETFPRPALLPHDPIERSRVRSIAAIVACDIHPLNNVGVLNYLKGPLGQGQEAVSAWYAHWIRTGFEAIEQMIAPAPYACGDRPTLADLHLVPQVFNARRFKVPIDDFPRILAATEAAMMLEAFARAAPEAQPDAE